MDDQTARKLENNQSSHQHEAGSSAATGFDKEYIIERAKKVMLDPSSFWPEIKAESLSIEEIYRKYLVVLAAIPAVCGFLGMTFIGIAGVRFPLFGGIVNMFVSYAACLAMMFGVAKIFELLAPKFEAEISFNNAMKLVAFSATPVFVFGAIQIIPALGVLLLIPAGYSLYLLYNGLPQMGAVPESKRNPYFAASLGAGFVVALVLGLIVAAVTPKPDPMNISINMGNGKSMSVRELQRRAEDMARSIENR